MVRIPAAARQPLLNALLAAALTVGGVLLGLTGSRAQKLRGAYPAAADYHRALLLWWLFTALIVIGLMARNRWPLAAFVLAALGAAGHATDNPVTAPLVDFAVPIVLYTLASLARRRWVPAVAMVVAAVGNYLIALGVLVPGDPHKPAVVKLGGLPLEAVRDAGLKSVNTVVFLVLAVALGEGARARRAHLAAVERRAADLEREQQQRAALATAAERARVTRELHDVVAHGLSVMVVQAQGAAAALERHPERAASALQEVIAVGRGSLAEMRRLLGVVRRDPVVGDPELLPQPGMEVLPALVDQVRAAGTAVRFDVRGEPFALPAGVDLSAYRIVQEALTNTLKHAGPDASVSVEVSYAPDGLRIEVADDGTGPAAQAAPPAQNDASGLRGIAERVAMLGGTLEAGPGPERGFRVTVVLPLAMELSGSA
jgi:signal transduction histidine kinase